jgi:hypothetical protein
VMGWSVRLHAVTVMLSLIVGATLAGLFGMLVAVPIVASVKVIFAHLWRTRVPWGEEVFVLDREVDDRGPPHLEAARVGRRPAVLPETASDTLDDGSSRGVEGPAL